ncbi:MAG: SET domain-containing protein [Candidatus Cyclobacteriaceae bacterium M3_2C_046]
MIHAHTELKKINDQIGSGIFATQYIPKGTITYVKDELEIVIKPAAYALYKPDYKNFIDMFSYIDQQGNYIISWDHAKYVNHNCDCNTLSTGYGFEIALRDIFPGQEITDDYGLFNMTQPMPLYCNCSNCRKVLQPNDLERYYLDWDQKLQGVLPELLKVPQPLMDFLETDIRDQVVAYIQGELPYVSVLNLKYFPVNHHEIII